ncbi:hypothetical protein ACFPMF_18915 [Larkinella bovis]|uniref:Uncharacterized protein n=1 Tax=Larkinella bovis TaxID=683041 RepID=A0ABW0IDB9_9BACT
MKPRPSFSQQPEQFRFVNRFGSRFLKNRIRMMNQVTKYHRSWPVYTFLLAVTALVTTMAAVEKHKNAPLIWKTQEPAPKPAVVRPTTVRKRTVPSVDSKTGGKTAPALALASEPVAAGDSVKDLAEITVIGTEKRGRYAMRKGERL